MRQRELVRPLPPIKKMKKANPRAPSARAPVAGGRAGGILSWRGRRLPSRPLCKVGVLGEAFRSRDLEAPSSVEGHRGALGGPSGPGPLAVAASLGAAPATPAHRGSRTWRRPFANRLARKLSASLVSPAAGSVLCGRAGSGGARGAATGGRSSTWVRGRPGYRGRRTGGREGRGLVLGASSARCSGSILRIPPELQALSFGKG
nr:uncharacterized protein LOC106835559 [Equus asinus]